MEPWVVLIWVYRFISHSIESCLQWFCISFSFYWRTTILINWLIAIAPSLGRVVRLMCMMQGDLRQAYFSTLQFCAMARRRNIASCLLPLVILNHTVLKVCRRLFFKSVFRWIDKDELYKHLRKDHYFCHFCDADGMQFFYSEYTDLRQHFKWVRPGSRKYRIKRPQFSTANHNKWLFTNTLLLGNNLIPNQEKKNSKNNFSILN